MSIVKFKRPKTRGDIFDLFARVVNKVREEKKIK